MYPEYTGTLLTAIANDNKPPTSAQETYNLAQAYVTKHGFTPARPDAVLRLRRACRDEEVRGRATG